MSSVEDLREFVNERLTAAAEEIFGVFKKTIVEYKEEIHRQRKLLDLVLKPEIKLHRIELPQQHVYKEEEEALADQQLINRENNSRVDQEEQESLNIKEEVDELCTTPEGDHHVLKLETDVFLLTPTWEGSDQNEPELNSEHQQLLNIPFLAESQGKSISTEDPEPKPTERLRKNIIHNHDVNHRTMPNNFNTHTGRKAIRCEICGQVCRCKSQLERHMRTHTGEKPYICKTCGKRFGYTSALNVHIKIHTGEKPYLCETCGKSFIMKSDLKNHTRVHTGEKPYSCVTCGKGFSKKADMKNHMTIHTGEKPYSCSTCGKRFRQTARLNCHLRIHTGEKPYACEDCGRCFRFSNSLLSHKKIHTIEKQCTCEICGRAFKRAAAFKDHMRTHIGEKPYVCQICGKIHFNASIFLSHVKSHTDKKACVLKDM